MTQPLGREPAPYQCAARYSAAEVSLIVVNGLLEGEHAHVHALLAEVTPAEAARLLPALADTAASALRLLDGEALEVWRGVARAYLASAGPSP